ncbi:hypothetical protein EV426DRAFT_590711 [Tirmania nivea]|nr:hypothetical protein EV426DRAFT_590711 [Tirmania nivea]
MYVQIPQNSQLVNGNLMKPGTKGRKPRQCGYNQVNNPNKPNNPTYLNQGMEPQVEDAWIIHWEPRNRSRNAERECDREPSRRSRNGCITCKQRRIKCDETKPSCEKCTKGRKPRQCGRYNKPNKPTYILGIQEQ